jgi:glycerol-3-phosphate cytidylyltransferase
MIIGYTTGVFDMFHIGHLNILRRSKELCDYLIVGVSTDELVRHDKNKTAIIPFENRCSIVQAIRYVDKVVPQFDKNKFEAWRKYHFNKMFVGSDWRGSETWNEFEKQFLSIGVDIVYLDHTDGISSTLLREIISEKGLQQSLNTTQENLR